MNHLAAPPDHASGVPQLSTLTSRFALAAAAVVLAMFAIYVSTGIGQDPLQYIHTPQEYSAILLKAPSVLRTAIGLDNLFVVLYSSMFLTLGATLWDRTGSRALLLVSLGLLAASGLLDLLENMHFMTMVSAALHGMDVGPAQIELQVWESLVKFHVSYLGLFLLGFALPRDTLLERALGFSLRWVQLPVGLLIYLTPPEVALALVLARFTFFLFALLAIGLVFRPRRSGSGAPR